MASSSTEPARKRPNLSKALAIASGQQVFKLQKLAAGELASTKPSGAFRRQVSKILDAPRQCFVQLCIDDLEGNPIYYWLAYLPKLLEYVVQHSSSYKERFYRAGSELNIMLNADEATAGNVLATSPAKKAMLFYVAVLEIGHLKSVEAWMPFGLITHRDLIKVDGGFSAVCAQVARHLHPLLRSGAHVAGQLRHFNLKGFIGDYEGVCKMISSKGAAALKPCCLCMNCVSSSSGVEKADSHFATIASSKFSDFHLHNTEELSAMYQRFLEKSRSMTQSELAERERQFGYILHPKSVLCCPMAREVLSLEKIIIDPLHCYFANGIASQEMVLLQQWLETTKGVTLNDLAASVRQVEWTCCSKQYRSPSARGFLFHQPLWQGVCYKGSASSVWYLFSLFSYYTSEFSSNDDDPELRSWYALMKAS